MNVEAVGQLARYTELKAEHAELLATRDRLDGELQRRFPCGFTGNGVPGDFEGLELESMEADHEYREFLRSEDGMEFKRLRAIFEPAMNVDRGHLAQEVQS